MTHDLQNGDSLKPAAMNCHQHNQHDENNLHDHHQNDHHHDRQEGGRPKPAARSKNRERRERLAKVFTIFISIIPNLDHHQ